MTGIPKEKHMNQEFRLGPGGKIALGVLLALRFVQVKVFRGPHLTKSERARCGDLRRRGYHSARERVHA